MLPMKSGVKVHLVEQSHSTAAQQQRACTQPSQLGVGADSSDPESAQGPGPGRSQSCANDCRDIDPHGPCIQRRRWTVSP